MGVRMELSIFDVLGPVMIGPSSSHTAGAAKLARMASFLVAEEFDKVIFYLHGSFAKTYHGHRTDYALAAGVLGLREDDEALRNSFSNAKEKGISFSFMEADLGNVHENSVKIEFYWKDDKKETVVGSSLGGGRIKIFEVNGFSTEISFSSPTIVIYHWDKKGVIRDISEVLARHEINIATMKVSRSKRGGSAFCVIETDEAIPPNIDTELGKLDHIIRAKSLTLNEGDY